MFYIIVIYQIGSCMSNSLEVLKNTIRTIENWPKEGVSFRDIMPLLQDASTFRLLIDQFCERYQGMQLDAIVAIDARGFLLGAPIAYNLGLSLVLVRKKGKLPYTTHSTKYELEYGEAEVEIHTDALKAGDRVVVVDDLIATGGTMLASCELIGNLQAQLVEVAAIIDLPELGGSKKLAQRGYASFALFDF